MTEGELETPNVTLSFWEPEREDLPLVANEAGFAVRVADVAEARAELEAKGVEFIAETWDSGVCQFAAFRDPDGNTVVLHRRLRTEESPAEAVKVACASVRECLLSSERRTRGRERRAMAGSSSVRAGFAQGRALYPGTFGAIRIRHLPRFSPR